MATATENIHATNLAKAKFQRQNTATGKPQSKQTPLQQTRQGVNSQQSSLAGAKARANRGNESTAKTATRWAGINRSQSSSQKAGGWLGGLTFGALGNLIAPGVGTVLGFLGKWLGKSIVGQIILWSLVIMVLLWLVFVVTVLVGSIMAMCSDEAAWALWTASWVSTEASMFYEFCK